MAMTEVSAQDEIPPHKPYVPDEKRIPEFTWSAVLVGAALGIVFGASSLYLVLKVGLTVSASIPVAVLSITLFRVFSKLPFIRRANILENNIVQTTGSAGESIAFGVGVTMPALMLLGFEMTIGRVMVVSILGGLLGILMMIPLRRAFIVKQHGKLKYPEGTACADVLIVGEKGGSSAATVFIGFGVAFFYEFVRAGLKLFKDTVDYPLGKIKPFLFKGAVASVEANPALLGVGYIIGTRIACIMVAGGILSSFVLIPAIRMFGDKLTVALPPAKGAISEMSEDDIWHEYILYIGAGAVAAGGIISVFKALPLIVSSIVSGARDIAASRAGNGNGTVRRTDRDLPLWVVGFGSLLLVAAIGATTPLHQQIPWIPELQMDLLGAFLIVLFGFLFVTVSSRLTGEIGSSSNPISGMTVATLLLTCLLFVILGKTSPNDRLAALSVAAVVCIAASNGGTTSQDLKTGYLVGATPKWQQLAIVVGALTSAIVIGWILIQLNQAYTIYSSRNLPSLAKPIDMAKVKEDNERGKAPEDSADYWVWRAPEGNDQNVPPGQYLVDDDGRMHYLVDPGINGRRSQRDDGTEVPRFKAPKAVLMSLITDGILRQKLPWPLVLLGVAISLVLELCGISSLAFAVGVYLPLSSSTPIFLGGLARFAVEKLRRKRQDLTPEQVEAESEFSPGSLLSTGYIAGGAIAGVLIAFLSFGEAIPQFLATWQYGTHSISHDQTLAEAAAELARAQSGYAPDAFISDADKKSDVDDLTDQIIELNKEVRPRYVPVPKGFELQLPAPEQPYTVPEDTTLGALAEDKLGKKGKAQLLLSLNQNRLIHVKKGMKLKLPAEKKYEVPADASLADVAKAALNADDPASARKLYDLNKLGEDVDARRIVVRPGTELDLPKDLKYKTTKEVYLGDVAGETLDDPTRAADILDMNLEKLIYLPKGKVFLLPEGAPYEVTEDANLGDVAEKALKDRDKSQKLLELNRDDLEGVLHLAKGAELRVPQKTWPATAAFGMLIVFLIVVGAGWLFRSSSAEPTMEGDDLSSNGEA
jgi:putative OPT family oligopeptide transporter